MPKKCRCKIISFGHINLYILLIILGALFKAAKELITSNSEKLGQDEAKDPEKQHPIIITINYALGLCLSFIFFIIYKACNKRNKNTNANIFLLERMSTKPNHNIETTKKEKLLWILLASVLDFIANIIYSYNWIKTDDYLIYWPSNILLMTLFSYLLLKMKLYKHHYLSVIIITIFGIAHNFIAGNLDSDKVKENYIGYIIYFFAEGTFNVLYVLYQFFMIKKSIKSYGILFFQGLIELILGIIILAITTKYFPKLDNFHTFIDDIKDKEIFVFISLIFINFVTFVTIFIIIDIFTPFHIFLLNILSGIIIAFFDETFHNKFYIIITYVVFIIISIFMILVFIEIIHLNFCGLSTMTKKNIEYRASIDSILNNENDNEDDDDNIKDTDGEIINLDEYTFELNEFNNGEVN